MKYFNFNRVQFWRLKFRSQPNAGSKPHLVHPSSRNYNLPSLMKTLRPHFQARFRMAGIFAAAMLLSFTVWAQPP
ncbi:MAG TPA: hypothetical protein VHS96_00690, partial [Bacteroidia bacterium]|nr:hypothetical protein [Bacteroidia bacterium]